MDRRQFLKNSGMAAAALTLSGCGQSEKIFSGLNRRLKPNIVFIYVDDQDRADLSCYGGNLLMPNIDRLTQESMRFDRFYVSSPVCTPSRFSALTGRYASRGAEMQKIWPVHEQINIGYEAGAYGEQNTIAHVMKQNGYKTGIAGKWMQGVSEKVKMMDGSLDARDPDVARQVKENYKHLQESVKSTGFDYAQSLYYVNPGQWWSDAPLYTPKELRHHNQEWITKGAIDFIEQSKDEPFFLYMPTTMVHDPMAYDSIKADPRVTQAGYLNEAPDVQPPRHTIFERLRGRGIDFDNIKPEQEMQAHFLSGTLWLDDGIGAVLDKLDELGLGDNTVVIYASDNGRKAKFSTYDSAAKMPCLIRWPGKIKPDSVCNELASNIDFAPTIYDICGITPPPNAVIDGKSLLPALTGGRYKRDHIFMEITVERAVVTDDRFKYIAVRYPPQIRDKVDEGRLYNHWCQPMEFGVWGHSYNAELYYPSYFDADQLYDLSNDPDEQNNLADNPEYSEKLTQMKEIMRMYSRNLPHPFAEFKKKNQS
jgi:arylsulfatase A-like enzyme